MKSVLYVAASLMIGASIYGFVDYGEARYSKEFQSMYHEDAVVDEDVTGEEVVKSEVNLEVAPLNIVAGSKKYADKEIKPAVSKASAKATKRIKKKRKVNYESFSRAAMKPEVFEAPELKDVTVKEK